MMDALPGPFRQPPPRPDAGALLASVAMLVADKGSVVLHVTAARHGEGTTTVARELAAALARPSWCSVAFLDATAQADPALPDLGDAWSRGHEPSLRDGRIGDAGAALGRLPGLASGAASLGSLRDLLAALRVRFTAVIVDCPPVLPCRGAATFCTVADGTLLVVEAEATRRAEVGEAREALRQLGATVLGTVLNKRQHRLPRFVERLI